MQHPMNVPTEEEEWRDHIKDSFGKDLGPKVLRELDRLIAQGVLPIGRIQDFAVEDGMLVNARPAAPVSMWITEDGKLSITPGDRARLNVNNTFKPLSLPEWAPTPTSVTKALDSLRGTQGPMWA